ncbi:SH3 domain-containing protein [Streptomyces spongiae]|uniref:SH3 domain-containing protein n=2 Tax=Streptomyces spongiae TaxID=565072 RepID=A0A5N8XSY5_9ACTN|nr:SH3 domain-containing protein [Streptomyces spongiae]
MSLRSNLMRVGILTAGGALVTLAASGPVSAGDRSGDGDSNSTSVTKGRVTAVGGLRLRDAPTRDSRVVRVAPFGEIVSIFCKTPGETVDSNPLWYLLTDGTWAWGAARFIDNIDKTPRWCQ